MIEALSTPQNRMRTLMILVACGVLAIAAAAFGISDNPPGILLAFLAVTAFVLAFVHPWRAPKQFRRLLLASAVGFVVSAVLHNVLEGIASHSGGSGLVHDVLTGTGGALFLLAILGCPMGALVGIVGAAVMSRRERKLQTGAPPA